MAFDYEEFRSKLIKSGGYTEAKAEEAVQHRRACDAAVEEGRYCFANLFNAKGKVLCQTDLFFNQASLERALEFLRSRRFVRAEIVCFQNKKKTKLEFDRERVLGRDAWANIAAATGF